MHEFVPCLSAAPSSHVHTTSFTRHYIYLVFCLIRDDTRPSSADPFSRLVPRGLRAHFALSPLLSSTPTLFLISRQYCPSSHVSLYTPLPLADELSRWLSSYTNAKPSAFLFLLSSILPLSCFSLIMMVCVFIYFRWRHCK